MTHIDQVRLKLKALMFTDNIGVWNSDSPISWILGERKLSNWHFIFPLTFHQIAFSPTPVKELHLTALDDFPVYSTGTIHWISSLQLSWLHWTVPTSSSDVPAMAMSRILTLCCSCLLSCKHENLLQCGHNQSSCCHRVVRASMVGLLVHSRHCHSSQQSD